MRGNIQSLAGLLDESLAGGQDPLANMNPKMKKKLLDDKKKREREVLQKKMAAGIDFLGENEIKFGQ